MFRINLLKQKEIHKAQKAVSASRLAQQDANSLLWLS